MWSILKLFSSRLVRGQAFALFVVACLCLAAASPASADALAAGAAAFNRQDYVRAAASLLEKGRQSVTLALPAPGEAPAGLPAAPRAPGNAEPDL
jgi:hypothetical protein